jgi:hypothetical protein
MEWELQRDICPWVARLSVLQISPVTALHRGAFSQALL